MTEIENCQASINDKANKTRDKITNIFTEIRNLIHERESTLKKNISIQLEKEVDTLLGKDKNIREHLQAIQLFKEEVSHMELEDDTEVLANSKSRTLIGGQAIKVPLNVNLTINFPEINKENELNTLWKILNPTSHRIGPTFYSTTTSYNNKNKKPLENPKYIIYIYIYMHIIGR